MYPNPHVDLVLHLTNFEADDQIALAISQFAQSRHLIASAAVNDSPAPESIRRINERTTYYTTGKRYGEGRSLTYFDASESCKVIRVVELGMSWNAQSQTDLDELRAALVGIKGVAVELGARFEPGVDPGRGIDEYCSMSMP